MGVSQKDSAPGTSTLNHHVLRALQHRQVIATVNKTLSPEKMIFHIFSGESLSLKVSFVNASYSV